MATDLEYALMAGRAYRTSRDAARGVKSLSLTVVL